MKRIVLACKPGDARAGRLAEEVADWLAGRGCEVRRWPRDGGDPALADWAELAVVLGGDGTLLHVARAFVGRPAPVLGVNLGRLGFLTDAPAGSVKDALSEVLAGHFKLKTHFALAVEAERTDGRTPLGIVLNDLALQRGGHPRMIAFELFAREQFVFRLRGDGLVICTPAGSTAYALSAGGPIIHPEVDAIGVVPICPHTLSNRPIVLPATMEVALVFVEGEEASLHLDGHIHESLAPGDRVHVKKGGVVRLVHLPGRHYFDVLRTKLGWAGERGCR